MVNVPSHDADQQEEVPLESMENFKDRVEEQTGIPFDQIPKGEENDIIGGHIFCKKDNVYVVGIGYPDEDPDTGEETYHQFRVVDLSQKQ